MATRTRRRRKQGANSSRAQRLIGWLVSYQDNEMGESHEIRTGRTLISSKNGLDGKVIELQESSIAAPHSAMSARSNHQLVLQDIFSESGTYLRRGNGKKEVQVNEPVELEHGDWIRIGEHSRFQVCLIDGPRG